jgi:acyl-CoA reductase-like NAD-dependent aldehyde dehydrogenase
MTLYQMRYGHLLTFIPHKHVQVSLELGGKSPHLIFDSADLDQGMQQPSFFFFSSQAPPSNAGTALITSTAANWAAVGVYYNTGQDCTAGSRVYVQDTIYDKFVALLVEKAKALKIGDGFDEASGGGPVVSKGQVWTHSRTQILRFLIIKRLHSMIACGAISSLARQKVLSA